MPTETTTHKSYFSRLGNSLRGVLFGLALFGGAIYLLFWNENRTVKRNAALEEVAGKTTSLTNISNINPDNEGLPVHFTAKPSLSGNIADPLFSDPAPALAIEREVEIYQWIEKSTSKTKTNVGGSTDTTTTYSYSRGWSRSLADSDSFHEPGHENPSEPLVEEITTYATGVTFGAFNFPDELLPRLANQSVSRHNFIAMQTPITNALPSSVPKNTFRTQDGFYVCASTATNIPPLPQIGDSRIKLIQFPPFLVSVIACQNGNSIQPYITENDESVLLFQAGTLSAPQMIKLAQKRNLSTAKLFRILGFILMLVGIRTILNPLKVLSDVLPFLGRIADFGIGIVSFLLAFVISLLTIAIAWLFCRPVLAISLLVAAAAISFFFWKKVRPQAK